MARVPQHKRRGDTKGSEQPPEIEVDQEVTTHQTRKPVTLPKVSWTDRPLPKEDGKK